MRSDLRGRTGRLQWSRGLVAAETTLPFHFGAALIWLQWSRGLVAAETRRRRRWRASPCALQWSRGLVAAETPRWQARRASCESWLQWSRGLVAAETAPSQGTGTRAESRQFASAGLVAWIGRGRGCPWTRNSRWRLPSMLARLACERSPFLAAKRSPREGSAQSSLTASTARGAPPRQKIRGSRRSRGTTRPIESTRCVRPSLAPRSINRI